MGYSALLAHEFLDLEDVLSKKTQALAGMVQRSKHLVVFAGAGLSTASGIHDYASVAEGSLASSSSSVKTPFDAEPTLSHRVLAALSRTGKLKHLVQQNHDGLVPILLCG